MAAERNVIQARIESIAAEIALVDPADLQALAELHSRFEEIARLADDGSQPPVVVDAALAAAAVIERIIMNETPDGGAALRVVAQTIGSLQEIVRNGRPAEQVSFPPELPLAGADAHAEAPAGVHHASALPPSADERLFREFLSRQEAAMGELEAMILSLAKTADEDSLASLKRLVHTLKGEAARTGPQDVERLCRIAEDSLGGRATGEMIDGLRQVKDWFGQVFQACAGNGPIPVSLEEVLARVTRLQTPAAPAGQVIEKTPQAAAATDEDAQADRALLEDFVCEAGEHLEAADVHLLALETEPHDKEAINAVFRAFHTIKGIADCLGLDAIRGLAHEAEGLLERARKGELTLRGEPIDLSFDAVDAIRRMVKTLGESLSAGKPVPADPAADALKARIAAAIANPQNQPEAGPGHLGAETPVLPIREPEPRKLGEILVEQGSVAPETIQQALDRQSQHEKRPPLGELLVLQGKVPARQIVQALRVQTGEAAQVRQVVRIDAQRLDRLLEAIGQLVAAQSMVIRSPELRQTASPDLLRRLDQLETITQGLQTAGLSLRMVPIRATFQKMIRLARDLAHKVGKPVEFATSGDDMELDRGVVDRISDPLVHMVRNALDHGIEADPEQRRQAGKPRSGRIELRAFQKDEHICIEVADDGRGLNRQAILSKAIERGLVAPDVNLTDEQVCNLIFEAGLSTAEVVTDVSGRGVGMDVVRRNVEQLRGQVEIRSTPGAGTTFRIRLPLVHKG